MVHIEKIKLKKGQFLINSKNDTDTGKKVGFSEHLYTEYINTSKTRSVKHGVITRSVKHVNVFCIITKTTKCLNIGI
jgi:hypothetical protein